MEDGSRILYSTTRTSLKLGEKALIQSAGVGDNVEVQEGAVVAQATVGDNVLVMPKQRAEGRVKSSSVVRPDKYKRSRKSDGSVEWEM